MGKNVVAWIAAAIATVATAAPAAAFTVAVSPSRIEETLTGRPVTQTLKIINYGTEPTLVKIRVANFDLDDGNRVREIAPTAESLDRWHDVERTMALNYYSPLRLIRGFGPGMRERRDGHIVNVSTWGVLNESSPLFAVYNASKAALTAVSRVVETASVWNASIVAWATDGLASSSGFSAATALSSATVRT